MQVQAQGAEGSSNFGSREVELAPWRLYDPGRWETGQCGTAPTKMEAAQSNLPELSFLLNPSHWRGCGERRLVHPTGIFRFLADSRMFCHNNKRRK